MEMRPGHPEFSVFIKVALTLLLVFINLSAKTDNCNSLQEIFIANLDVCKDNLLEHSIFSNNFTVESFFNLHCSKEKFLILRILEITPYRYIPISLVDKPPAGSINI